MISAIRKGKHATMACYTFFERSWHAKCQSMSKNVKIGDPAYGGHAIGKITRNSIIHLLWRSPIGWVNGRHWLAGGSFCGLTLFILWKIFKKSFKRNYIKSFKKKKNKKKTKKNSKKKKFKKKIFKKKIFSKKKNFQKNF